MILVTGGTGTSGAAIVRALLDRAERPRVLARDPEKAAALLGDDVEIARGDTNDPASLDAALEGVDRALLLSPSVPQLAQLEANFVDAAKRAGVERIVKFSVIGADPNHAIRFQRQHAESEQRLKASGIAWTMLRPTFFLQNLLGLRHSIRSGAIHMPTGNGRASHVDVRDIAAVAAAALTEPGHEGKAYDITGPASLSYADIAAILTRVLGHDVKHVDVTPDAARQALLGAGIPQWNVDGINELSAGVKDGIFDVVTTVVRDVGGKDPITPEQFIREHAGALR
jgi:uncharacterized protein YbjT (DUF2867 family)